MYDTIVVGVGAAGAACAAALARAGRRVLALEAQGAVGGRVRSCPVPGGVVELGAEWIHGQVSSSVYDLATQHKVPLRVQDLTFEVYRSDGTRPDRRAMDDLIDYCLRVMEEGSDNEESLGHLIERKLRSYAAERYPALLNDEDFTDNFLRLVNLLVVNHEAADDWRHVSALSRYTPLEGEQHVSWHRHGYRTLFDILLNTYNGGPGLPTLDIKLNKEVTSIQWSARGVRVRCADGAQYSAGNAVVTVSLGVLKERHSTLFTPPLPASKVSAIEDISIGVMNKVILCFPYRWWDKQTTFYGFLWRDADRRALPPADRWVAEVFGASDPMGAEHALTLWTSGEVGRMVESLPEEEVRSKLVALLQRFVGRGVTIPQPTMMLRSTWYSNPFTRGSYSYDNLLSPRRPTARLALSTPLTGDVDGAPVSGPPRVLFAGEATDEIHFSTVHGAVDSGRREAERLLKWSPGDSGAPASKI